VGGVFVGEDILSYIQDVEDWLGFLDRVFVVFGFLGIRMHV
jgi:hypothetical protein